MQFLVPPDLPLKSYKVMHYVPEPTGVIEKTPIVSADLDQATML